MPSASSGASAIAVVAGDGSRVASGDHVVPPSVVRQTPALMVATNCTSGLSGCTTIALTPTALRLVQKPVASESCQRPPSPARYSVPALAAVEPAVASASSVIPRVSACGRGLPTVD